MSIVEIGPYYDAFVLEFYKLRMCTNFSRLRQVLSRVDPWSIFVLVSILVDGEDWGPQLVKSFIKYKWV